MCRGSHKRLKNTLMKCVCCGASRLHCTGCPCVPACVPVGVCNFVRVCLCVIACLRACVLHTRILERRSTLACSSLGVTGHLNIHILRGRLFLTALDADRNSPQLRAASQNM